MTITMTILNSNPANLGLPDGPDATPFGGNTICGCNHCTQVHHFSYGSQTTLSLISPTDSFKKIVQHHVLQFPTSDHCNAFIAARQPWLSGAGMQYLIHDNALVDAP